MAPLHFVSGRPRLQFVLVLLFLLPITGCGGGNKHRGKVSGKVTYKGEPVSAGTVTFFGPNNEAASAPIGKDGTYQASAVPVGDVSVTVSTPPAGPSPAQAGKNPLMEKKKFHGTTEKSVTLPNKYAKAGTSGLRLTVSEGSQPFDIPLN